MGGTCHIWNNLCKASFLHVTTSVFHIMEQRNIDGRKCLDCILVPACPSFWGGTAWGAESTILKFITSQMLTNGCKICNPQHVPGYLDLGILECANRGESGGLVYWLLMSQWIVMPHCESFFQVWWQIWGVLSQLTTTGSPTSSNSLPSHSTYAESSSGGRNGTDL